MFYIIEMSKKGDGEKWTIEKRFREFDDLNKSLKKVYRNLQNLPAKTVFPLKDVDGIERRRVELQQYLQVIVSILSLSSFEIGSYFKN